MIARRLVALVGLSLALWPSLALACPNCRDPRDPNQSAFLTGTILLSLLPLAMIGAVALYVRHRLRCQTPELPPATTVAERRAEREAPWHEAP